MLLMFLMLAPAFPSDGVAYCFPSGFRVVSVHRSHRPMVGMAMLLEGGSSVEKTPGIAHLVEHLWFRSRPNGNREIGSQLDEIARGNATTSHDATTYLTLAPRSFARALWNLEIQRLVDPLTGIDVETFDIERDVVRNEALQRGTWRRKYGMFAATLPKDHPYNRNVDGSDEQLSSLTLDDARSYAEAQYRPDRATLYVDGDLSHRALERLLDDVPDALLEDPNRPGVTDAIPCTARARPSTPVETAFTSRDRWEEVPASVDAPRRLIAWNAGVGAADAFHASVLASRLDVHLRVNLVPAKCWVGVHLYTNLLACETDDDPDAWPRRDRIIAQALEDWASSPKGTPEVLSGLDWAPRHESLGMEALKESVTWAHWGLGLELETGEGPLAEFINTHLGSPVRVVMTPSRATSPIPGARFHDRTAARRTEGSTKAAVDETYGHLVAEPPLQDVVLSELDNGIPLWLVPVPWDPMSSVTALFPMQAAREDGSLRRAAWMWVDSPDFGQLIARDNHWGLRVFNIPDKVLYTTGSNRLSIKIYGQELADGIDDAVPPPIRLHSTKAVARHLARQEAQRQRLGKRPVDVAAKIRWDALADGIPHPHLTKEGRAAWQDVKRGDVRHYLQDYFSARKAHFVAAAPARLQELSTQLRVNLEAIPRWEGGNVPATVLPTRQAAKRAVYRVPAKGPQASITLACHLGPSSQMALDVLQGLLESRLNNALRNDLGATYGVYVSRTVPVHGPTLELRTAVPPELSETAIFALFAEINDVAQRRVATHTLNQMRRRVAVGTAMRFQRGSEVASLVERLLMSGQDPRTYSLADELDAVSADVLADAVAPCHNHEVVTILGPPPP